jgi:deoxyadenosine/deoxycytidine kinase
LRNFHFSIKTINNMRSLERKIGMYEIMRHYRKDHIILVDEGPILAAHMFIFTDAPYSQEEISKFIDLLPLPDLVVYIRASIDVLIQRTLRRADPPREMNIKDLAQTQRYIKSAVTVFDQLVKAENIRCRLLIVESMDFNEEGYSQVVENICQTILHCKQRIEGKEI